MSELWAKWEGEVIDGGLPLRRLVGVSDHSGVFLSEAGAYGVPKAAIKLVPAIPTLAESQLAHWNAAAGLSHPRLLRLFAMGRCQLGNLHFLYVLMEYADQNLAQLLDNRALTDVEARETLPPTLDALAFLHSRNMVQGQLKPSNILVVGDQLKLASDTIRPAGELATSISMSSQYDPPEGRDGSISTAGDIWALGVTLYEGLTRATPEKPDERSHGVVLPADFPPALTDVIRECLSRRPADRPSVTALQDWVAGKVKYRGAPSSSASAPERSAVAADRAALASAGVPSAAPDARRGAAASASGVSPGPEGAARAANYDAQRAGAAMGTAAMGVNRDARRVGTAAMDVNRDALRGNAAALNVNADALRAGAVERGANRDGQRAGVGPSAAAAGVAPSGASSGGGLAGSGRARGATPGANYDQAIGADRAPTEPGASQAAAFSPATAGQPRAAGPTAEAIPGRLTIRAVVEREPFEEEAPPAQRSYLPWVVAGIAILAVGWGAFRLLGGHSSSGPASTGPEPSTNTSQPVPQSGEPFAKAPGSPGSQTSKSAPAQEPAQAAASEDRSHRHSSRPTNSASHSGAASEAGPGSVAHEEIPTVPRSALATIHGRIKVIVRVTADESGNVISDNLDRAGPSQYFAKLAAQAARKWKFVPDGHKSGGVWLIHFEFARTGATAHATGAKS